MDYVIVTCVPVVANDQREEYMPTVQFLTSNWCEVGAIITVKEVRYEVIAWAPAL